MRHRRSGDFNRFLWLATVLLAALPILLATFEPARDQQAQISSLFTAQITGLTLFKNHYLSEPVSVRLKNATAVPISISAPVVFKVHRKTTSGSYNPVFTSKEFPGFTIRPGKVFEWKWGQQNQDGTPVGSGDYRVEFLFNNSPSSAAFKIIQKSGSNGYLTFGFGGHPDTMRTYLSNAVALRRAINSFYGLGNYRILQGPLVDDRGNNQTNGKSPYDPQWRWHLSPTSSQMVYAAIELCDGWPAFVESDLDYWVYTVKEFCPWAGYVSRLE